MATMNAVILMACLAVTAADYATKTTNHLEAGPVLVRAPAHDSAIIQSHRLGGNFAYSTHEAHAYAVKKPIIAHRPVPIGVSYHQGEPIHHSTTNYVTAHIPRVGYTYPATSSYSSHGQGYNQAPVSGYGYNQAPVSGYGYNQAPVYPHDVAGPVYGHGVAAPSYGYGVPAPVYDHGVAGPVHGQHHEVSGSVYGHGGVAAPSLGYGVPAPVYDHGVVGPIHGSGTPIYTPNNEYPYDSNPHDSHNSYAPVYPHNIGSTSHVVVKGHKYD